MWSSLTRLYLPRNLRTNTLAVVAAEAIDAGEVLDQYLGEIEHPVRAPINAEKIGALMRFASHAFEPVAKFVEVGNGRRVTAVVSSMQYIRRGQEVTVDYGDDMWFIGRCLPARCRHRDIQDENDP
ncbi:hypothetical protein PC118_g18808 [Phytophthora cactorum]|uniref:SET domain-containing protein n=1 Tax=Phytophthora cactorum TaxID=29920 RepID=A0A8T0YPP1_9STRA|nr:hypothetical protein PC112_g19217 [Phytophthora cactorum]KAG2804218.1 hypothetical protein PC111_g18352 [Phytophthora cactorum]KAG2841012.1 hypothetical protein PC113_g19123 [Phytophthora cactorum]KAG2967071.1 hypothetical protein PC118_g18808 [Phytophthora cactorum]KAG2984360.1 hypothetical protein PC119_g20418 [Phytophthora cactorum]